MNTKAKKGLSSKNVICECLPIFIDIEWKILFLTATELILYIKTAKAKNKLTKLQEWVKLKASCFALLAATG